MWHAWIEFGGWIFWSITIAVIFVEFMCVAKEQLAWAFGIPAIFVAVMTVFSTANVMSLATMWQTALMWAGIYVGIGVAWAIVRWILHAMKRKAFFYDSKRNWAEGQVRNDLATLKLRSWDSEALRVNFLSYFIRRWNASERSMRRDYSDIDAHRYIRTDVTSGEMYKVIFNAIVPKASQEKSRITMWMMFWPFSVVCYFFEDFVVEFYKMLGRFVSKVARGINTVVFFNMKKEMS